VNSAEIFDRNINLLVQKLESLTRLTLKHEKNPLVAHLIAARTKYHSGDKRDGCRRAAYAQFAIEDLQTIAKHDPNLLGHFAKRLNKASLQNYFGLRLEMRMAASLIGKSVAFQKSETPDFVLTDWQGVGIECASTHLDLESIKTAKMVVYKVASAVNAKNDYQYTTPFTILAVDVTNLLFHEGQEQCTKILADKDNSKPMLLEPVNESIFQSMLYFAYEWKPVNDSNGVILTSHYVRIDRSGISPVCKDLLEIIFPLSDEWTIGMIQRIV
jgi:hypothetical protein